METLCALGASMNIYVSERHTFGTDAVLLSHFAAPKREEQVVDLCTGCGIIPFLWCLERPPVVIHAVDIQSDAAALAEKSAAHNAADSFFHVHHADLKNLDGILPAGAFDLVTCNPPYGLADSGRKSPEESRRTARHEEQCTIGEVAESAARLLRFGGRLCLCHRPERLPDVMEALRAAKLEPKILRLCAQRPGEKPFLFLLSARRGGRPFLEVRPTLYIEDHHGQRTEEIKEIYGQYGEGIG